MNMPAQCRPTTVQVKTFAVPGDPDSLITQDREAWDFGVPGLVVTCGVDVDAFFITHLPSGCAVGYGFESPEAAVAALMDVAALADWTQPAETFAQDKDLAVNVWLLTHYHGGRFSYYDDNPTYAEMQRGN